MSNSIQDCINLTFVTKIQISVVNFIRCHYNPGWYSRKFLDPRNKNKHKQIYVILLTQPFGSQNIEFIVSKYILMQ